MLNLGILGGTFNPIHIGHLIMAEYTREKLNLDKVLFIPTGNPPHKNSNEIEKNIDRLNMINKAIQDNKYFISSDIELKRNGITYTYDTLKEIKSLYNANINFIIGWDTFLDMKNWYKIKEVLELATFVVVNRNIDLEKILIYKQEFIKNYGGEIKIVDIPNIEISSSDIRKRKGQNESIMYMVTKPVHDYIIANDLYRGDFI